MNAARRTPAGAVTALALVALLAGCGGGASPHLSVDTLDLPPSACGNLVTTRVELDNPGGTPLRWDASIEELAGATVTPASGTLEPGARVSLELAIPSPSDRGVGEVRGRLVVRSDGEPARAQVPIAFETTGTALRFDAKAIDFGEVPVGAISPPLTMGVVNDGDRGADAQLDVRAPFSVAWDTGPRAEPGVTVKAQLRFAPTSLGEATQSLALGGPGVCTSGAPLPLVGRGVDGVVGFSPGAIAFGAVDCGSTAQGAITVLNTSSSPFEVSASMKLGAQSRYVLPQPMATVPALGQITLPVLLPMPTDEGMAAAPYDDAVLLVTTAPKDVPHTIALSAEPRGSALRFPTPVVDLGNTRLDLPPTPVHVKLVNQGNVPATVSVQLAAPMSAPATLVVAAQGSVDIPVLGGDSTELGTKLARILSLTTSGPTCGVVPAASLSTRYTDRVQQVATGGYRTVVLAKSGHVYSYETNNRPKRVPGLSGVSAEVTAAGYTGCARLQTGGVRCWGSYPGDGTTSSATPVNATGIADAVRLAGGGSAVCAILASGSVRCWGSDSSCLVGSCTAPTYFTPTPVPGLGNVVQLAIAYDHQCAILASNAVACWGRDNLFGKLGDGTFDLHTSPESPATMLLPPGAPSTVSVNATTTCVTTGTNGFWCAGRVPGGLQDGIATPVFVASPYPVLSLDLQDWSGTGGFVVTSAAAVGTLAFINPVLWTALQGPLLQVSAHGERACFVRDDRRMTCTFGSSPPPVGDEPGFD